jgi:hypothetical protein
MPKKQWRKRTHGTARQIGNAFPLDSESQQSMKAKLPRATSGVRASREIRELKEKYEDDPRKLALIEEMERESEEKANRPKKTAGEKIKSVVKSIKPPEKKVVNKMVGGLPTKVPVEEKETPFSEMRLEILPVQEELVHDGHALSNYLKSSRIEHFFEKRVMMRKLRKEQEREKESK